MARYALATAALALALLIASTTATELQGLDSRVFIFDGEAGTVFNLISEQYHQVNALFVEGQQATLDTRDGEHHSNATHIGSMGLKLYNMTVQVDVSVNGSMTVAVNGVEVALTRENDFEVQMISRKVNVTTHKFREETGESVHVVTDLFDFTLWAAPRKWDEENQALIRGHLNMGLWIKPEAYVTRDVHGILGQIAPDSHPDVDALPEDLQTAFLGDGDEMDYVVSGLFEDDFEFNRFGVAPVRPAPTPAVTTSRRLLRGAASSTEQALHAIRILN